MLYELLRSFHHTETALRRRIVGIAVFLVLLNIVGWVLAFVCFAQRPALLSTCLIAWGFGLRHAVDADHNALESGTAYDKLKGIMIRGDCEVIDEPEEVWNVMRELRRFQGEEPAAPDNAVIKERAKKRAILKITPVKTSSWDHSKLPKGTY